jgi:hypothetical protein
MIGGLRCIFDPDEGEDFFGITNAHAGVRITGLPE